MKRPRTASRLRASDAHRFEQTHRFEITVTTARPYQAYYEPTKPADEFVLKFQKPQ
jgi:hypothetical protein